MVYKCENCGRALEYNPELRLLECKSCGSLFAVEQVSVEEQEKEEEKNDREFSKELASLCSSISDEEFKKAKKKLKINFARDAETVSDISDTIGYYMSVCDDLEAVGQYLNILENLTKEDVLDVAGGC